MGSATIAIQHPIVPTIRLGVQVRPALHAVKQTCHVSAVGGGGLGGAGPGLVFVAHEPG
jgi:hypothetical protein